MRLATIVALFKVVNGVFEIVNVVGPKTAEILVLASRTPLPPVSTTGIPTRNEAVVGTVTVVPELLAPTSTGSSAPTRYLAKTQTAS
jgi:hypothetical protein